jgi:hypothetical protein
MDAEQEVIARLFASVSNPAWDFDSYVAGWQAARKADQERIRELDCLMDWLPAIEAALVQLDRPEGWDTGEAAYRTRRIMTEAIDLLRKVQATLAKGEKESA